MAIEPSISSPPEIIRRLKQNALDDAHLQAILLQLTPEQLTEDVISNWISALLETAPEMQAMAYPVLDCCGTGGSGLPHFNTSTIVAFVLASGGIPVVKFGNRGIQQPHGSFDFLASLGFNNPVPVEKTAMLLEKSNLSFLFAPQCYPYLAPLHKIRKTLASPTLFHYIGPLLNPVLPAFRLMGVSNQTLLPLLKAVLCKNPTLSSASKTTLLAHTSLDNTAIGLDELSFIGKPVITAIQCQTEQTIHLPPAIPVQNPKAVIQEALNGLTVQDSVNIFKRLLNGELPNDPYQQRYQAPNLPITSQQRYAFCYELVTQNAALGFIAAGKASQLEEGLEIAQALIHGKKTLETFKRYQETYDAYHQ